MYWFDSWRLVTQNVAFDWLVVITANISLYGEVNYQVSMDIETDLVV